MIIPPMPVRSTLIVPLVFHVMDRIFSEVLHKLGPEFDGRMEWSLT